MHLAADLFDIRFHPRFSSVSTAGPIDARCATRKDGLHGLDHPFHGESEVTKQLGGRRGLAKAVDAHDLPRAADILAPGIGHARFDCNARQFRR